jgi:sugar phosphate isomerase/epimerase
VAENLEGRLEHVRKVLTLAYDLGPRLVVVYAGAVPPNENPAVRTMFSDSLISLGRHGERIGSTLALAAGMEPPATLAEFLRSLTCGGLGVNLDPGGLLMRNLDPYEAVRTFQDLVVYTHARDALADRVDRSAQEVPLGHGDVDWNAWFGALEEVAYHGWVTIRRGPSTDPVGDIRSGVAFLRRFVGGPVQ